MEYNRCQLHHKDSTGSVKQKVSKLGHCSKCVAVKSKSDGFQAKYPPNKPKLKGSGPKNQGTQQKSGPRKQNSNKNKPDQVSDFEVIGTFQETRDSKWTEATDGSKVWQEMSGWNEPEENVIEEEDEQDEEAPPLEALSGWKVSPIQETEDEQTLRDMYTGNSLPSRYWGPMQVVTIAGGRRSVVASRDIAAGELLAVSLPLAITSGPFGEPPELEALAKNLLEGKGLSPGGHAALGSMWGVEEGNSSMPIPNVSAWADEGPVTPVTLPIHVLERVMQQNAHGEEGNDVVLEVLRSEDSRSVAGLWPEVALLEHSCLPSAEALVVDDRCILRAAEPVPAGDELTLSYLGAGILAPPDVRQRELQEGYGFVCRCSRCEAEAEVWAGPLGPRLRQCAAEAQALAEKVEEASEEEDMRALALLRRQASALRDTLERELRSAALSPQLKSWVQASLYQVYEVYSLVEDECAADADQLSISHLAALERITRTVVPASGEHVDFAAEVMARTVHKFGRGHNESEAQRTACAAAFRARYGPISDALLDLMIDARMEA